MKQGEAILHYAQPRPLERWRKRLGVGMCVLTLGMVLVLAAAAWLVWGWMEEQGTLFFMQSRWMGGVEVKPMEVPLVSAVLPERWKWVLVRADAAHFWYCDDNRLADLARLSHLRTLEAGSRGVTDAGLVHVEGLTCLENLDLDTAAITDAGLVHLRKLRRLEHLHLSFTKVSDAGVVHLTGLRALRELYLRGTDVTAAGEAELHKALPGCTIVR